MLVAILLSFLSTIAEFSSAQLSCDSCDAPVILKSPNSISGNFTFENVEWDTKGCILATLTCHGNEEHPVVILEFNSGQGGTLSGEERLSILLFCNEDTMWTTSVLGRVLVVTSLSCDIA
ncbi:unnamed protein product, partial [Mesorhabditis belari]|uniref:C6 domain-containing protein n=1 Tax=Mesorhabditis belari TaxID=2138241 RepID=A0AAF3ENS6_9BILA